ncbi:MAG TPA: secretin N-terminal domain-containing protein [Candidatus Acidoferrales bacterium]|nr:secretin N-terminal domain-containing protein [Candidatus Acidoferrales bacterium]
MAKRCLLLLALGCASALVMGCPKGGQEESAGRQAEVLQDYDNALIHYQRALRADPSNAEYKLKAERVRFEDANYHFQQGVKARDKGDLQGALAEFQKASAIDPSNSLAAQEAQHLIEALGMKLANPPNTMPQPPAGPKLAEEPPKLNPLPRAPITIKMTNDSKILFDTIAQDSGITVVFDPDFASTPRRITVNLTNVTYQDALDITALESKAFWKPVTPNVIFVADVAKRKDYEEDIVRTFRLTNITADKDLNEIVTAIRGIFNTVQRISAVPSQNAIVVRDTPDRVMLIGKLIDDLDKAKPEVLIQVEVLQASRDRVRDLGISLSQANSVTFNPPSSSTTTSGSGGSTTTPSPTLTLNQLKHLSTSDYSVTLPSATVNTLLTDSTTRIIQDPQIRSVDNVKASIKIGTRVPIATGSFQAGLGAGTAGTGSLVSPLVNTQFQYQDVGVNVDLTPRILADRDVAMHIHVDVSSVTGTVSIGGINQPEISQRVVEEDVRLKDGEANILGGFIERTDSGNLSGWPGLSNIPILRYLFATNNVEHESDEVLIVLIPHVVRMPSITEENLRSIASGTDANPFVREVSETNPQQVMPQPTNQQGQAQAPVQVPIQVSQTPGVPVIAAGPTVGQQSQMTPMNPNGPPTVRFEPSNISLKPGGTTTVAIVVENVKDLASIPLQFQYNPAVISVDEVRHGGFLSGDTQEALVQRIDQPHGSAIISATRMQNLPGVSGTGTVVALVIRGLAPGDSKLSIVQVNAKDSAQKAIPLVTVEGAVHVQ